MSMITKRIWMTWVLASLAVAASTACAIFDTEPTATATSTVLTQARDLGILGGIVIAFMLIVGTLYTVDAYLREKASRRTADAILSQSLTTATALHNMMEHSMQMSAAADLRISKFIAFASGRPCFMADDAHELLREASKAASRVASAAAVAASLTATAAATAAKDVIETAISAADDKKRNEHGSEP